MSSCSKLQRLAIHPFTCQSRPVLSVRFNLAKLKACYVHPRGLGSGNLSDRTKGVAVSAKIEALKSALAAAAAADSQFPLGRFEGRGIVICAGGARLFTCAWVCIALLRSKLGCTLPVEIWHLGPEEMGPAMRGMLDDLGAQAIDALEVAKRHQVRCLGGWELKTFALLHSRFREVLFLDADNVPVRIRAIYSSELSFRKRARYSGRILFGSRGRTQFGR